MSSSAKSSAAPSAADTPPLASFASLPYELRTEIVALASTHPPDLHRLDHGTCASLRLVSRDAYGLTTRVFLQSVTISRPSQLRSFLGLLTARPALGRLVQSLHLDPTRLHDHDWWPEMHLDGRGGSERYDITTSLRDKEVLPHWCCPRRRWCIYGSGGPNGVSPRDKAVDKVLSVAKTVLGVGFGHPCHTYYGQRIGPLLWLIRVMEAQAALDIYLMHMRKLEDAAGLPVLSCDGQDFGTEGPQERGPCVEYPSPVLSVGVPAAGDPSSSSGGDAASSSFVITRAELLAHLAAPGSATDNFDHPLVFARSGIQVLDFTSGFEAHGSRRLLPQMSALCYISTSDEGSALDGFTPPRAALPGRLAPPPTPDLVDPFDVSTPNTSTVGGNLALARSLLALTPQVKNLFLAGFLQAVLCGSEAPVLPSLRWLCLGPLSIHSDESLPPTFGPGRFPNLEHLRLINESASSLRLYRSSRVSSGTSSIPQRPAECECGLAATRLAAKREN